MQRLFASLLLATAGVIGLLVLAAPLEAGGGGHGCPEKPREGTNEPVTIRNSCFTPAVLYVAPGTTVTWTNEDELPHNVTFIDGGSRGVASDMGYRKSVSHAFAAGLYAYYCSLHPSMLGVVAVGDPAGFAIKQPDQQLNAAPPAAPVVSGSKGPDLTPAVAGLVVGVGLISAGGGYLLRRRLR